MLIPLSVTHPGECQDTCGLRLIYELRRILRVNGKLIFNAPWLPRAPGLELKQIWVAESTAPMNDCGVISVFQKIEAESDIKQRLNV